MWQRKRHASTENGRIGESMGRFVDFKCVTTKLVLPRTQGRWGYSIKGKEIHKTSLWTALPTTGRSSKRFVEHKRHCRRGQRWHTSYEWQLRNAASVLWFCVEKLPFLWYWYNPLFTPSNIAENWLNVNPCEKHLVTDSINLPLRLWQIKEGTNIFCRVLILVAFDEATFQNSPLSELYQGMRSLECTATDISIYPL